MTRSDSPAEAPYARLTPDRMLDALESVGLRGDGRFIALNSYENRVYQVSLEDGRTLVAKFYRPQRWSDAQIREEHEFVADLAEREIPVVAPMALDEAGATLASFDGYRFAVYPRRGGRAPELDDPDTLERIGRFIGRIHAVGAVARVVEGPGLGVESFGVEPRDWLLANRSIPADLLPAWTGIVGQAIDAARRAFDRAGDLRIQKLHGDCHAGNVLWTDDG